jgi:hypothetical protein
MAYTMVAERDSQKIRKQRESALIVLANAKVMEAEGWQVVITDEEGNSQPLAAFEASLTEKFSSWYKPTPRPFVATTVPSPNMFAEPVAGDAGPEAIVAAELAAEAAETAGSEVQEIAEDDFETLEAANTDDQKQAVTAEREEIALDAELAH